jgi:hypothetical protein
VPLGASESPDSAARLAEAIARLRQDPALTARPPEERRPIEAMLERIASLPPEERAKLNLAKAQRVLALASGRCAGQTLVSRAGQAYAVSKASPDRLELRWSAEESRADGSRIRIAERVELALATGLAMAVERQTVTLAAGTSRTTTERLTITDPAESPSP